MSDKIKWRSVLSYFTIGIIWWIFDKEIRENEFSAFHFKQWLIIFWLGILLSLVNIIFLGSFFAFLVYIVRIWLFILSVIGAYSAFNGIKKELPIIGKYVKNINI
jgi:uncharacterized membrane protein